jgi:hypothetical protein
MSFPFGQFGKFWFIRHMSDEAAAKDAARRAVKLDRQRPLGIVAKCPKCGRCVQTYADETDMLCIDGDQHELFGSAMSPARVSDSFVCG